MDGWRAAVVTLALVLAGCAGGFGGESRADTPTPTVDSAPRESTATELTTTPTPTTQAGEQTVSDERQAELDDFAAAVESRATRPVLSWEYEDAETVVARIPSAFDYRHRWDERNATVFEAAAESLAGHEAPPERVVFRVENRSGVHAVTVTLNRSVAVDYVEHRITTPAFRTHVLEGGFRTSREINRSLLGIAAPEDHQQKWDYAIWMNRSANLTYSEVRRTSVTNNLVVVEGLERRYTTKAIVLTLQHPRTLNLSDTKINEFNRTIREQAVQYWEIINNKQYGNAPKVVKFRYIDEEGEVYAIYKMDRISIKAYVNGELSPSVYNFKYVSSGEFPNGGPNTG